MQRAQTNREHPVRPSQTPEQVDHLPRVATLAHHAQRLRYGVLARLERQRSLLREHGHALGAGTRQTLQRTDDRLARARLRLDLLDPRLVLQRGYALLTDEKGAAVTRIGQTHAGQALTATLADGEVDLAVLKQRLI